MLLRSVKYCKFGDTFLAIHTQNLKFLDVAQDELLSNMILGSPTTEVLNEMYIFN